MSGPDFWQQHEQELQQQWEAAEAGKPVEADVAFRESLESKFPILRAWPVKEEK